MLHRNLGPARVAPLCLSRSYPTLRLAPTGTHLLSVAIPRTIKSIAWTIGEICMIQFVHSRADRAARLLALSFCNLPRPYQSRHHPAPFASTMKLFLCLVLAAIATTTASGFYPRGGRGPRGLSIGHRLAPRPSASANVAVDDAANAATRRG